MERLTERDEFGNADIIGVNSEDLQLNLDFKQMNKVTDTLNKLAEYEDLEKQGLLLRLPCHIGDSIYSVVEDGLTIIELKFSLDFYVRRKNDFGKTVFLTKAEAEQKLKELRGKQNGKID